MYVIIGAVIVVGVNDAVIAIAAVVGAVLLLAPTTPAT